MSLPLRCRSDLPASGESQLLVDEVKLFEIVNNLVSNALKFTRTGFVELGVHLSLSSPSASPHAVLHIEVKGHRAGHRARDLDKVFVPFVQVAGGPARRATGIGLSLAVVKDLVAALSGQMRVESTSSLAACSHVTVPVKLVDARVGANASAGLRPNSTVAPENPHPDLDAIEFAAKASSSSTTTSYLDKPYSARDLRPKRTRWTPRRVNAAAAAARARVLAYQRPQRLRQRD